MVFWGMLSKFQLVTKLRGTYGSFTDACENSQETPSFLLHHVRFSWEFLVKIWGF